LEKNSKERKEKAQVNLKKNNKNLLHDYKPSDYGLSEEFIKLEFKNYIEKYEL
jgi:hypothetical protein